MRGAPARERPTTLSRVFRVLRIQPVLNVRDWIIVLAENATKAHDIVHSWQPGWLTSDIVEEGEPMLFQPLERDRRYRFSVQLWNSQGHYTGTDVFDGRVLDCFVRVEERPGGLIRDVPLRDVFRADDKPCHHEAWEWNEDEGMVCTECNLPLIHNTYHAHVVRDETKFKVYMFDPRTRMNVLRHTYSDIRRANEHAGLMMDAALASAVKED
jgi:hypothetical protein